MINYKKLYLASLLFALQSSVQAITILNETPEAMAAFGQVGKGTRAQTLAENIAPNSSLTIELIEMPRNLYARDAQYNWTNVPQLDTSNHTFASLNNSTLKISPDGAYKKNASWNIKLELVSGSQLETKGKRADAAVRAEVKQEAAATTGKGDAKRSHAELAAQEVKEREAVVASRAAAIASNEITANIYHNAPDTERIFKLPNGNWFAAQRDGSGIDFDPTGKNALSLTDNEGNITDLTKIA